MKYGYVFLIILILLSSFVIAGKIYPNTLIVSGPYCKMYGNCILENLTIMGSYLNVSVVNYNYTGLLTGDNMLLKENLTVQGKSDLASPVWIGNACNGTWAVSNTAIAGKYISVCSDSFARQLTTGTAIVDSYIETNGVADERIFSHVFLNGNYYWLLSDDTLGTKHTPMHLDMSDGTVRYDNNVSFVEGYASDIWYSIDDSGGYIESSTGSWNIKANNQDIASFDGTGAGVTLRENTTITVGNILNVNNILDLSGSNEIVLDTAGEFSFNIFGNQIIYCSLFGGICQFLSDIGVYLEGNLVLDSNTYKLYLGDSQNFAIYADATDGYIDGSSSTDVNFVGSNFKFLDEDISTSGHEVEILPRVETPTSSTRIGLATNMDWTPTSTGDHHGILMTNQGNARIGKNSPNLLANNLTSDFSAVYRGLISNNWASSNTYVDNFSIFFGQLNINPSGSANFENIYGLNIEHGWDDSEGWNGVVNNSYGVKIQDMRIGNTNYAIHTGDGQVYLGDNLTVEGAIFNDKPHMYGLSTKIGTVAVTGTWYNITFNDTLGYNTGFTMLKNETLIIPEDGDYTINFGVGVADASPAPNSNVAVRIKLNNGELQGSYKEFQPSLQNNQQWLDMTVYASDLSIGDTLTMQYIASDTDVIISAGNTYATQPFNAYGYIIKEHD